MIRSQTLVAIMVALAMLLLAATVHAAPLTSATWFGSFQGTPFTWTTAPPLGATGTSLGSASIDVSISVNPTQSWVTTVTGDVTIVISQTLVGSAGITATPMAALATKGIAGNSPVKLVVTPMYILTLFTVPLSVGGSGVATTMVVAPLVGDVTLTASFVPWQVGAFTASGLYNDDGPLPDFTTAGSFNLNGAGNGTVTLVAPSITTVCAGPGCGTQNTKTAGATKLVLNFGPEPGTTLLFGAAFAGFGALAFRRRA